MKKLFLYIFLGLLLCNTAFGEIFNITCKRNLWWGVDKFNFHFSDSKASIIVDRNQKTLEDTFSSGIATFVYLDTKKEFFVHKWGNKYDFFAYRYTRVDSNYSIKEFRKKYKGQLDDLEILRMQPEGIEKPTASGELFYVDLEYLYDIRENHPLAYPGAHVFSFICSDSF